MESSIRHRIEKEVTPIATTSLATLNNNMINNNNNEILKTNNLYNDNDNKKIKIIYPYHYKYDLLYAIIPLIIILLIFGEKKSILILCFGCLICYIFDLLDFIEVSIKIIIFDLCLFHKIL